MTSCLCSSNASPYLLILLPDNEVYCTHNMIGQQCYCYSDSYYCKVITHNVYIVILSMSSIIRVQYPKCMLLLLNLFIDECLILPNSIPAYMIIFQVLLGDTIRPIRFISQHIRRFSVQHQSCIYHSPDVNLAYILCGHILYCSTSRLREPLVLNW